MPAAAEALPAELLLHAGRVRAPWRRGFSFLPLRLRVHDGAWGEPEDQTGKGPQLLVRALRRTAVCLTARHGDETSSTQAISSFPKVGSLVFVAI